MQQSGKKLSMHSDAIYKGTYTNNGTMLKIHENAYTVGYSELKTADGTSEATVKFGNGVFYKKNEKSNIVHAGGDGTNAFVFAGVMVRDPSIASGYPVNNDEVSAFQKGLLLKEGYVVYKTAKGPGPVPTSTDDSNAIDVFAVGDSVRCNLDNGTIYFGTGTVSNNLLIGKVVDVNPDDRSVTVYISPAFYLA